MRPLEWLTALRAEELRMIPKGVQVDAYGLYIPEGVELTEEQYKYCLKEMDELRKWEEEYGEKSED